MQVGHLHHAPLPTTTAMNKNNDYTMMSPLARWWARMTWCCDRKRLGYNCRHHGYDGQHTEPRWPD